MELRPSAISVVCPDEVDVPAYALRLDFSEYEAEVPTHQHHKGQLVLAHHGAVICKADDRMWIVPPNYAVWIPGGMPHSNRATSNARLTYLFIEPGAASLPGHCCTLSVSSMVREMIEYLARFPDRYEPHSRISRLVGVLLEELALMPKEDISLPISVHPKIGYIADALSQNPADRSTIAIWARRVAMSERSLARLIMRETGLTFGRWRQQLHLIIAMRELAGGASVQNVADILGYHSVTAFITNFKKVIGETPARYFQYLQNK